MSFCCCSLSCAEDPHSGYFPGHCQETQNINPSEVEQTVTLRSELNPEDEIMTSKEMEIKRREENMQVIINSPCPRA